jgi:hypothetical protein
MPAFDEKFCDEQRDAAAHARVELGMTYRRIVELAADGQLEHRGRKVDPFKISPEYVKDLANKLVRQRAGKTPSKLADRPHHDAVEILRRRTVACADALLEEYEKTLRKRPQEAEPKRLREIVDLIRYLSQLSPAQRATSTATRDEKAPDPRRGSVGVLLREVRGEAAQKATQTKPTHRDSNGTGTEPPFERAETEHDATPGALVSERIAQLQPEHFDLEP